MSTPGSLFHYNIVLGEVGSPAPIHAPGFLDLILSAVAGIGAGDPRLLFHLKDIHSNQCTKQYFISQLASNHT